MRISQVEASKVAPFHTNNLKKRWALKDYYDPYQPCLFFGASSYSGENTQAIVNHKSYKIVFPISYMDFHFFMLNDLPSFATRVDKLFIISPSPKENHTALLNTKQYQEIASYYPNIKIKKFFPELKDYSAYKPISLGDKIYYHSYCVDCENPACMDTINLLRKKCPYELITTGLESSSKQPRSKEYLGQRWRHYVDADELKENYYNKCFLNLNLSRGGSMMTAAEFGLMGIKTIIGNPRPHQGWLGGSECPTFKFYDFPSCIKYSNFKGRLDNDPDFTIGNIEKRVDVLLDIIYEEAKKIGTTQLPMNPHRVGQEWLDIDFWESNYLDI